MSSACLVIGDWQPAILLDSNLEHGTAGCSNTFSNLPLTSQEFQVKDMECWALTRSPSLEEGESRQTERGLEEGDLRTGREPLGLQKGLLVALVVTGAPENFE